MAESKSALSCRPSRRAACCRLASTLSLFMLISTLVQSAAACMTRVGIRVRRRRSRCADQTDTHERDRGHRQHAEHRRRDAVSRRSRARRRRRRSSSVHLRRAWCRQPGLSPAQTTMEGWRGDGRGYSLGHRPEPCRPRCPPARRPVRPRQRPLAGRLRDPRRPRHRRRLPAAVRPRRGAGARPDHRSQPARGAPRAPTSSASATCTRASSTSAPSRSGCPTTARRTRHHRRRRRRHRRWQPRWVSCNAPVSAAEPASTSTPTRKTRRDTWCTSPSPGWVCPTSPTTATSNTPRFWPPTRDTSRAMFALVYGGSRRSRRDGRPHRRAGNQVGRRALGRGQAPRRRPDLQPAQVRRSACRGSRFRLGRLGDRAGRIAGGLAEVVVRQPDYLTAFAARWCSEDLEDWKRWARWRLIHRPRGLLTDDLVGRGLRVLRPQLTGTEQIRDRWKRGVGLVESLMGDAVGKLYVSGISRRTPRPGWTSWWPTCVRHTGSASPTWTG